MYTVLAAAATSGLASPVAWLRTRKLPGASASRRWAMTAQGSSASSRKCRTDTSSRPVGWLKSISSWVSGAVRTCSGCRTSAWRTAVSGLFSSSSRLWATATPPGAGRGRLGHLVHVPAGRDARADVQELPDAVLGGQEPDRPAHEVPVGPGDGPDVGLDRDHRPGRVLIGPEV